MLLATRKAQLYQLVFQKMCVYYFFFKIILKCQKIFTLLTEIKNLHTPKAI